MYGTAASVYGTAPVYIGPVPADTALSATDAATRGLRAFTDVHNPVLWVVGILLVTVGAIGVAGSGRVGPFKVSGSAGKA